MTLINAMRADFPVVDPDSTLAAAASRSAVAPRPLLMTRGV